MLMAKKRLSIKKMRLIKHFFQLVLKFKLIEKNVLFDFYKMVNNYLVQ